MSEKRHVVRDGDGWAVKKPGAERASSRHDDRDAALERAEEIVANAGGGNVVLHGDDGQIERVVTVERGEAGGGATTPPRDEDGKFVSESDGTSDVTSSTPPRDEDGKFVAEGDRRSDDAGSTPPRDEDGKFAPEDGGDSTALRDVAASVLGKRTGADGGGSLSLDSIDKKAVADMAGKGARTVASALGTAGKVGASAAIVATSAAVGKARSLAEEAKIERARRATHEGTSDHSADARSDHAESATSGADSASSPDLARDAARLGGDTSVRDGVSAPVDEPRTLGTGARPDSSLGRAFDTSVTADDADRHGAEAAGRAAPPLDRGAALAEDVASPVPARRSRLLGSLFDRVRRRLGADGDRPRAGPDRTRPDGVRRDDHRDDGDDR